MLGNQVDAVLREPEEKVHGELRKQTVEGIWLYGGWAEQARTRFYPQHRIVEVIDCGRVPR